MEEDSYIVSNFHSICRLCLRKSGLMSPLFEHGGGPEPPPYLALAGLAELRMEPDDGLPARICHRCLYRGEQCVQFREQCAASDAKLRRLTRKLPPAHAPQPSVVMVVDPSLDYDSSDASDAELGDAAEPEAAEAEAEAAPEDALDELDESLELAASKVFMCQYCDRAFTESARCREHERREHDARAPWGCSACGLVFAERAGQAAHARSVHACARPYTCAQCDKAFGRRSDLRKHSVVHTGVRPYRCHFCLKSFSRNTNLSKHLRIHSGQKPHVCPQCPRSFISKGDLSRHALVHSGAKPFSCSVCSLSFGRRDKLIKHEARHARVAEPEAAKEAADARGEAHESMVIDLDPFKNLADEVDSDAFGAAEAAFEDRGAFDRPRVPEHISGEGFGGEPRRLFKSEPSPSGGSDDRDAFDGDGGPDDDEPKNGIRCRLCPRRFSSSLDFDSHMQLHEGVKSFHCELCNKTFMRKRELDRHAIVHTGFKPFECSRCDKKFGRKDKLVRHERIHDEKKEYNCFECPSTFSRKDTLMAHIKTHFPDLMDDHPDGDAMSDELDDGDDADDDPVGDDV